MMQPPILVVDDEPHNVEAFRNYLERSAIGHEFVPTLSEAACVLYDAQQRQRHFGAIVLDNHFHDHDLCAYDPNFNGIDLAIVLQGKFPNFHEGHHRFATDFFGDSYTAIATHYQSRIIMFSGSAPTDSILRPDLFSGIIIAPKMPDRNGSCCERSLVDALETLGYDLHTPADIMEQHKQRFGLENGVESVDVEHERRVREFLLANGMSEAEVAEYCTPPSPLPRIPARSHR